jgi:hypothetical protein
MRGMDPTVSATFRDSTIAEGSRDRPVHRCNLCTGRSFTESDDTRCCIKIIWPPEDEQDIARNMYMNVEECNKYIKNLCIKLVIG